MNMCPLRSNLVAGCNIFIASWSLFLANQGFHVCVAGVCIDQNRTDFKAKEYVFISINIFP